MQELQRPTNDDEIWALMMDALDGNLDGDSEGQLNNMLATRPELMREWQALQAIDQLLLQAPLVSPAPDINFVTKTIARLPNVRSRRWLVGGTYALLLLVGLVPFLVIALLIALLGGVTFLGDVFQILGDFLQVSFVLFGAFGQGLFSLGRYVGQQPAILGSLLVMVGSISLWSGVYRQMILEPQIA